MKAYFTALFLALCLCIGGLTALLPVAPTSARYSDWNSAYADFVADKKFLTAVFPYTYLDEEGGWGDRSPWGTDGEQEIYLRDMDADGTPELIITNGHWAHLDRHAFIYTFADGSITYLGNGMPFPSRLPDSSFPGYVGDFYAGSGMGSCSYYWKNGNKIVRELIYSYNNIEETEKRETDNMELYSSWQSGTIPLYSATASEISEMGWAAFAEKALG